MNSEASEPLSYVPTFSARAGRAGCHLHRTAVRDLPSTRRACLSREMFNSTQHTTTQSRLEIHCFLRKASSHNTVHAPLLVFGLSSCTEQKLLGRAQLRHKTPGLRGQRRAATTSRSTSSTCDSERPRNRRSNQQRTRWRNSRHYPAQPHQLSALLARGGFRFADLQRELHVYKRRWREDSCLSSSVCMRSLRCQTYQT